MFYLQFAEHFVWTRCLTFLDPVNTKSNTMRHRNVKHPKIVTGP